MQKKSVLGFYIITLGCQMNKNDSERIAGLLSTGGWRCVLEPEQADFIILNTCSVRQAAEDRVFGLVKNWQKLKEKNPELLIAVTGCMPGRDKKGEIKEKLKGVDLFFSTEELPMLKTWIAGLRPHWELKSDQLSDYLSISPKREMDYRAFVTIQTGCDNYCTYCVVPYSRGREKNRPVKDIITEIRQAAGEGAKEIWLLGQVVNHYIAPDPENFSIENPFAKKDDFAAFLWEVNQIDGIERISWTAPDPQYFSDSQIEALKFPKQMNYLHLPVQSGDNEILKKMNRHYSREKYIELVKKIRRARPDISLGTDIIVGFCGETDEQFANTVDLYKQCDFDIAYLAMYSERSGTAAAKAFKDDVPRTVKKQRWQTLQDLMEEITFKKNQKYFDQEVEVLVDKFEDGICTGNSSEYKMVQFLGAPDLIGKMVKIKITQALTWLLKGMR